MNPLVSQEQHIYARWLERGARASLAVLILSFLVYALGLLEPLVPLHELPRLWSLPVDQYLAASGAPRGWGWLRLLDKGDYLNYAGVVMLGLTTVVCYARLLPLLRRSQQLHAWLAVAQIVVLLAAASGFFAGLH